MRHLINGEEYDIPTNPDGTIPVSVIRKAGHISDDRVLIMKRADGSNEVINPGENLTVNPGQHFSDLARVIRGH